MKKLKLNKTLEIKTSPHLVRGLRTDTIMKHVTYTLIPISIFAIYAFGLNALLVLTTAVASAVLTEHLLCMATGKPSTIYDYSAVITGLLLGLTLPPNFPLWMVFVGSFISIALGKFIFGGLGANVFNPALVGRAVLQAAFPVAITTWYPAFTIDRFSHITSSTLALPFLEPVYDVISGATPLSAMKFEKMTTSTYDLIFGLTSGSTGETSTVIILLAGAYLVYRKMMDWRIPLSIFATVFILSGILHLFNSVAYPSPMFMLFSGGLMLGSIFMATDMVGSPVTAPGAIIFGVLIGVLEVVIRIWGGLPEGIMYAILLANAVTPHIDNLVKPRVFGTGKTGNKL